MKTKTIKLFQFNYFFIILSLFLNISFASGEINLPEQKMNSTLEYEYLTYEVFNEVIKYYLQLKTEYYSQNLDSKKIATSFSFFIEKKFIQGFLSEWHNILIKTHSNPDNNFDTPVLPEVIVTPN